jgi:peroxiredoxin
MGAPQPGDAAPEIDLPTTAGTPFQGASLRGTWVLLHFTASWCPYCDAEVAHLGQIAQRYAGRAKVVLVAIEEDDERWAAYAKEHVPPSVIALKDRSGDVARRFAPPGAQPSFQDRAQVLLDSTILLDPKGTIRLFLLPDSKHFDPTFTVVRGELDRRLAGAAP